MIFGAILGKPSKVAIVAPSKPEERVVMLELFEDDHGTKLHISWPSKPKATKIVRL